MTPHNEAKKEDIAKTVIMPGDPLRAQFIAEHYLKDAVLVNQVRGMYAYTGTYKGEKVTVMASGMGIPSMGIYSYELYHVYDVDRIIRIGTAGSYCPSLRVSDVLLVTDSFSESNYAREQNGTNSHVMHSSEDLNKRIESTADRLKMHLYLGKVHCGEALYKEHENYIDYYEKENCVSGEMESFALFHNANVCKKQAACLLTISNSLVTGEETSSTEREKGLNDMITLALESILEK